MPLRFKTGKVWIFLLVILACMIGIFIYSIWDYRNAMPGNVEADFLVCLMLCHQ